MTRNLNLITQLLGAAGQTLIPSAPIPDEWKTFLHAVVGFGQITVSLVAHAYTPTGEKI